MSQTTVRIRESTRAVLKELARTRNEPMLAILDRAVEEYRRRLFLESVNEAYAKVRANPNDWAAELKERTAWDGTLGDGLDGHSHPKPKVRRTASRKGTAK